MKTAPRSDTHARALQSLGAMTATVAHEMRNVLGGVELYATLVAEQCATDADLQPMTGRLLEGVTRLRAVAANLLSVSRRPEPAIEHTTVDLVMLLGTLAENTALALPGTGVELTTDVKLAKAPSQYIKDNIWVTTSGMCSAEPLTCTLSALGNDRVIFAADYPFESADEAAHFIDGVPLDDGLRAAICRDTAAKLLGL